MPIIRCVNLSKSYDGELVFKDVTLELDEGDALAVLGPSGSGKTTLLKIIGLLLRPSSGVLYINDVDVTGLREAQLSELRRKYIGYSFQEPTFIPHLDIMDNILIPIIPWVSREELRKYRDKALDLLDRLGLKGLEKRRPDDLSTGQRKRADLARALLKDPKILIVDEPTANLDEESADVIRAIIKEVRDMNKVVIFALHRDRKLVRQANKKLDIERFK